MVGAFVGVEAEDAEVVAAEEEMGEGRVRRSRRARSWASCFCSFSISCIRSRLLEAVITGEEPREPLKDTCGRVQRNRGTKLELKIKAGGGAMVRARKWKGA